MIKHALVFLTASACLGFALPASANDDDEIAKAVAALDAQLPGKLINNPYDIQWRTDGADKKDSVVKSEGAPGGMAYQVKVKKRKPNPWDTATRIPMTTDIAEDDVILMSFWARAAQPPKGKEMGDITVALQRNIEPYDSIFEERMDLGQDWKLYSVAGTAGRDYSADKTQINFNLAYAKQTIEFGQFYVMNLGPGADPTPYMK